LKWFSTGLYCLIQASNDSSSSGVSLRPGRVAYFGQSSAIQRQKWRSRVSPARRMMTLAM
jgi:hypothetical protein